MKFPLLVLLLVVAVLPAMAQFKKDDGLQQGAAADLEASVVHKDLWPLDGHDLATLLLSGVGLLIAAGGGVGGGGILVPLFIMVLQFGPKHAIPLSTVTILGGAIVNTIFAALGRHPRADRPLVDWDLVLVMEPITIVGAVVGSFVNKVLPALLISILLVIVLGLLGRRTTIKGINMHRREAAAAAKSAGKGGSTTNGGLLPVKHEMPKYGTEGTKARAAQQEEGMGLLQDTWQATDIVRKERSTILWKPALLTLCFLGVGTLNVLKGGPGFELPGLECGSPWYWVITLSVLPWTLLFFLIIRAHVLRDNERKQLAGYRFQEDDVRWTPGSTIKYPLMCCTAGLFAGMFGVGGGIIIAPLMLEMNVAPPVAAASMAVMILYTAAAAVVGFFTFGLIPPGYGLFFFVWGALCTCVGQTLVKRQLAKHKKESLIVLSIGAVVLLSAILMGYQAIDTFVRDPSLAFKGSPLCGGISGA